jgi:hypothetical protein
LEPSSVLRNAGLRIKGRYLNATVAVVSIWFPTIRQERRNNFTTARSAQGNVPSHSTKENTRRSVEEKYGHA